MDTPIRIAIVEDERDLLEAYGSVLKKVGAVSTFLSPAEFLSSADGHRPPLDIVVTDIKMPGMDGLSMLEKLRELGYDCPAIVISGNLDKDAAVTASSLGVSRILEKPISMQLLLDGVRHAKYQRLIDLNHIDLTNAIERLTEAVRVFDFHLGADADLEAVRALCLDPTDTERGLALGDFILRLQKEIAGLKSRGDVLSGLKSQGAKDRKST